MEKNFTISEILIAINEIQNRKKTKKSLTFSSEVKPETPSIIPKDTIKLIEEAEKNHKK
jgi:hypothetical protein|tara:strand:- start:219 stop:395 length:177 start_codon:yes stop_codon:yes gene_type:complete